MIKAGKGFQNLVSKLEEDLSSRFPNMMQNLEGLSIGLAKDAGHRIAPSLQHAGVYANFDSVDRSYYANPKQAVVRFESPDPVMRYIEDSLANGKKAEDIKKTIDQFMYFDPKVKQYVIVPTVKGVPAATFDSLLGNHSLPVWNIGFLNKIFKQPFARSFAKHLVSVEGFSNPWADAVAVYKASFEGFGRVSTTARGTVEQNLSQPVSMEHGMIMSDVINLAVDYESSIEEQMRAQHQPGNFLSAGAFGDRERYANMVLERLHDLIIIFGNSETNTLGLISSAISGGIESYAGASFTTIMNDINDNMKGATIVEAMNNIIQGFLEENLYLPTDIRISCSTRVMRALTSTTYSKGFNPASPMEVIKGRFDSQNDVGGGVKSCSWTLVADPMLNENTPFNPNDYDLFIMTVPSVDSALESQSGLVISPELMSQFIVPPLYQRSGLLYTMYKRIGGIIAPVENTVKVLGGVGFSSDDVPSTT